MIFKLSYLNSNLALTLGYFNPALNNSALQNKKNKKNFTLYHGGKPLFWLESKLEN